MTKCFEPYSRVRHRTRPQLSGHRTDCAERGEAASEEGPEEAGDENAEPAADEGEHPNPDGFVPRGLRMPKGSAVATAHAEAVLLDRTRALLDAHYDEVFTSEWLARQANKPLPESTDDCTSSERPVPKRPRRYHVDPRVLEARTAQRFETFSLPATVLELLRHPRDEKDWGKLEHLRALVVDLADGIENGSLLGMEDQAVAALRLALPAEGRGTLAETVVFGDVELKAGTRVLTSVADATLPAALRVQCPTRAMDVALSKFRTVLPPERLGASTTVAAVSCNRMGGTSLDQDITMVSRRLKLLQGCSRTSARCSGIGNA